MASQNSWLEAWKTKAAGQEKMLSEQLSRKKPAGPYLESLRKQYLQSAEKAMDFRKEAFQAYATHLHNVSQIIGAAAASGNSSSSKRRGSLGD